MKENQCIENGYDLHFKNFICRKNKLLNGSAVPKGVQSIKRLIRPHRFDHLGIQSMPESTKRPGREFNNNRAQPQGLTLPSDLPFQKDAYPYSPRVAQFLHYATNIPSWMVRLLYFSLRKSSKFVRAFLPFTSFSKVRMRANVCNEAAVFCISSSPFHFPCLIVNYH